MWQGVGGRLVIARRNEGCEKAACRRRKICVYVCMCVCAREREKKLCFQDGNKDLIDVCVCTATLV